MIIKPPQLAITSSYKPSVFLAGTIDMGASENWQKWIGNILNEHYVVFNPRRDDWDSSWEQTFENPNFYQQVNWELNAINKADFVIFNFLATSKSPITFLELGICAEAKKKIFVCCPKEFYRSGNVQIICDRYNIPIFERLAELLVNFKN